MSYLSFMLMMQVRVRWTLRHLPLSAWFMSGKLNWPAKLVPSKCISILCSQIDLSVKLWSFCSSISIWSARMSRLFMVYWEFYLLCDRSVQRKCFLQDFSMHAQESYASVHVCQHDELHGVQDIFWGFTVSSKRSSNPCLGAPVAIDRRSKIFLGPLGCRQCSTT